MRALTLHNQGRYEESIEHWRAVLARNINFELAYLGIGRGLSRSGYMEEALWYLRRANNRQVYSEVFEMHRRQIMSDHFNWFALGFLLICVGCVAVAKRKWIIRITKGRRTAYVRD
jgi:tetratricopeptide (TPR) repeat protein